MLRQHARGAAWLRKPRGGQLRRPLATCLPTLDPLRRLLDPTMLVERLRR